MKCIILGFLMLSALHVPVGAFHVRTSRPSSWSSFQIHSSSKTQLEPEENPTADPNRRSLSGVRYRDVLEGLHSLYPPTELDRRNAASRTDGYWPFINKGEEPPLQFTYGEFDFYFFAELLDKAKHYYNQGQNQNQDQGDTPDTWDDKVFVDIGSGTGRLVLAAAALHPGWKLCRGIEVLKGIHAVAEGTLQKCRHDAPAQPVQKEDVWVPVNGVFRPSLTVMEEPTWIEQDQDDIQNDKDFGIQKHLLPKSGTQSTEDRLKLAPVNLSCGSFEDPYEFFGDADIVFVFSSCMSINMMQGLSKAMGRQCKPGTIIITTEYQLPLEGTIDPNDDDPTLPYGKYKLELVESIDGYCWLTGGESTALIHRVVESLWVEGSGERYPPELTIEEQAFRAIKYMEAQDTNIFVRSVYNDMIFNDFPDHWLPKLETDDKT